MNRMLFLGIILLFLACKKEPKPDYDVVISNTQAINLETGTFDTASVFIKEGKIALITNKTGATTPLAKKVIDGSGKYLLPGFWDNHVHFRGGDSLVQDNKDFLKLFIANGITTVRDAGGNLTEAVMQWKQQIGDDALVGPTIFTSGPKIDGPNATWAGSLEVITDADIQKALDSLESIPVDFVKLYDSRISGEHYLETIREAEKRGLITSGHMPFTVTLDETVEAGIDAIEHLYYVMKGCSSIEEDVTQQLANKKIGFWQAMPLLQNSYDTVTAANTFKKLKEKNVFVVPTLHIGKTLSYLDEVNHSQDEYLKYMSDGIQKTYEGRINRVKNSSAEAIQNRKELDAFFGELAKALNDAGVSLLAGSDCGAFNSYTYPGISLHNELEEMVANGISPLVALRSSTLNGADFLGKQAMHGTIEEGKMADLVLLDANPLEAIVNTRKINTVIKNGTVFTKQDLEELLNSVRKEQAFLDIE